MPPRYDIALTGVTNARTCSQRQLPAAFARPTSNSKRRVRTSGGWALGVGSCLWPRLYCESYARLPAFIDFGRTDTGSIRSRGARRVGPRSCGMALRPGDGKSLLARLREETRVGPARSHQWIRRYSAVRSLRRRMAQGRAGPAVGAAWTRGQA